MLATLVLTLVHALERCAQCSTSAKDVSLCEVHAREERSTFARVAGGLGASDPAARSAALEALADLTTAHDNAPSRRVAERLASALKDPSFPVRERAAELLGPPQNALVALSALLDALRDAERELGRAWKELGWAPGRLDSTRGALARVGFNYSEGVRTLEHWRAALLAQLARCPDDRVVEAILKLTPRGLSLEANEALLQLATRKALQAVVENLRFREEQVVQLETDLAAEGKKPRPTDPLEAALADASREHLRAGLELVQGELGALQAALQRLAEERGLGPAPVESPRPHEPWKLWLAQHLESFPEHLPGVSSPVW